MLVAGTPSPPTAPGGPVLNSTVLTPQGFQPRPAEPGRTGIVHGPDAAVEGPRTAVRVEVPPGPLLGREHLRVLQGVGMVTVDEASRPGAGDTAALVAGLSLAGIPVATRDCSAAVRALLPGDLLAITDRVERSTVLDPGLREVLSLQLRRCADEHYGYRIATDPEHPVVAVLVDGAPDAPPATLQLLQDDLAAQTWPAVQLHGGGPDADAVDLGAEAVYLTRVRPGPRYGPEHLTDLVAALVRSGRPVAHSPARFRWHPRHRLVVEDRAAQGDVIGTGGLPGGSLWYAGDGAAVPTAPGYVVHGANMVADGTVGGATPDPGPGPGQRGTVLHRTRPAQLDWLSTGSEPGEPVPSSYFSTATLLDARS